MLEYLIMQVTSQSAFAFLPGLGTQELLIILFIILLLFGAKKLPELAKGLGKSMREFKKATSDIEEDFRNAMEEEPVKPETKTPAKPAVTKPRKTVDPKAEVVVEDPEVKNVTTTNG